MKRTRSWVPAFAVSMLAVAAGGWFLQRGAAAQESASYRARLLQEVQELVAERYVEPISDSELNRMAIDGMLRELDDPYSVFIGADEADDLELTTTGNYGGLGIRIQRVGEWVTVMGILPGTPAERQGMATGDRIYEVEGESARGWTADDAVEHLRGPAGESVRLSVLRPGVRQPIELTVVREEIHVEPVVAFMVEERIGFVRLETFSANARAELESAIDGLRADGARGLVLDLRTNPGGLLDEGVAVSDLFLPRGAEIVETRSRIDDQNFTFRAGTDDAFPGLPIVVLVDRFSASASEIVAGALQDHDRAAVVGDTTFGKGSVQTLYQLPGGHHLKLTTAGWYTPSGRSINRPRDAEYRLLEAEGEGEGAPEGAPDTFRTESGRTVHGGGGIEPDLVVLDSLSDREREFAEALSGAAVTLNQLAVQFAANWGGSHPDLARDFVVTPEMRDTFLALLGEQGVEVDRELFDDVRSLVDPVIASQLANYAFGETERLRRAQEGDLQVAAAVRLLRDASTPKQLLSLVEGARGDPAGVGSPALPEAAGPTR
jgi:carboxyl-terminal processing protease